MVQGVLFDMDGLMFDTERLAVQAWNEVSQEMGVHLSDVAMTEMIGMNEKDSAALVHRELGADVDYAQISRRTYEVMMRSIAANGMPLKRGLRELLSHLKAKNIRMALATSTARARAADYLHRAVLREYFDDFATGDEIQNGKPAPDVFLLAAKRLALPKENLLVLEDSTNGLLAAQAAEIRAICVPDMKVPPQAVLDTAVAVLPDLYAVQKWIDTDNAQTHAIYFHQ